MAFFGLFKSKPAPKLTFKTGQAAIEYARRSLTTDWKIDGTVLAIVGEPKLQERMLTAPVTIPEGQGLKQIISYTTIKEVIAPDGTATPIDSDSPVSTLGLQSGDLVTVLLAGKSDEFGRQRPGTDGWIAFILQKNALSYSENDAAWTVAQTYRL